MLGFDVLTLEEAVAAVDYVTIVLLFGMMIVVANLRLSGFFRLVSAWTVRHAHRPSVLLAAVVGISGLLSAFFVNDTVCLAMTPLVLEVAAAIGRNPVPYLLAVAGVEKTSLEQESFRLASRFHLDRIGVLSGFAALLSNLVSNVPAVLVFRPLVPQLPDPRKAWLALAMSSTLAGNLTLLGSVANLIVVERARHEVKIGFWEYFRTGAPLTLATLALGAVWLSVR
jgi:Na+/H+ antiporter NhaD/arsenite permease-like protein